jgi:hypothetical protein
MVEAKARRAGWHGSRRSGPTTRWAFSSADLNLSARPSSPKPVFSVYWSILANHRSRVPTVDP